jgi:hypothetical protein
MIEKFNKYKYIYPPRPELKTHRDRLEFYDNDKFIAQPKLNGSCCEIYTGGGNIIQNGRHRNTLTVYRLSNDEIQQVIGNSWNVVVGEYMNKSKKDENNNIFNHKLVLFDQVVINGDYLLGSTFEERLELMNKLYNPIDENEYLYKLSENIYMVKSFLTNFANIWDDVTKIDMMEGLVLKKKDGKLERGIREKNNVKWMIKIRKTTSNYNF